MIKRLGELIQANLPNAAEPLASDRQTAATRVPAQGSAWFASTAPG